MSSAPWAPQQGAVSLTFDDGSPSQLEKALPLLDRFNLKATFFLGPWCLQQPEQVAAWQRVAAAGHEIGNHSWSHPGSTHFGGSGGIEEWTLAQIEADVRRAQELLAPLFPQQQDWTYCYPCYQTDVGRGLTRQSYVPLIARQFLAARALGEPPFGNHPLGVDLAKVWGVPAERYSGQTLIGMAEAEAAAGRWLVLTFHDVEGSRLSTTREDLEMLCTHLARHADRICTDTFAGIARRVREYQRAAQHSTSSGP
jgi:peptidoglycan/xylan/chitin deacetylase (PgdA/CDA1 family)